MLEELHVENYALIERLTLEFSAGMNTLTGETGAGKSILAGALSLLLGTAASTTSIRNGASQALVSGTFLLPPESEGRNWLEENGIESEDNRVIIRRVLKSTGKGAAYIQGVPVNRQQLSRFTSALIDMHGQHEHQSLFNLQYHRRFLDAFGDCEDLCRRVQQDFIAISEKKEELKSLQNDKNAREREMDLLRFAMKEINELDPQIAEDQDLEQERQKLQQYESLFSHVGRACNELKEGGGGGLTALYNSMIALKSVADIDPGRQKQAEHLESLYYELEDELAQLNSYKNDLSFEPKRMEFIGERLADLSRLKKKYGPGLGDVREYLTVAAEKLERLEHSEDYSRDLLQEIRLAEKGLMEIAGELSLQRKQAAGRLEGEVQKSLLALGMPRASFKVAVRQKLSGRKVPLCGPSGLDQVEFLLSANKGESLKPLRDIASGGEISRVMLAIKNALAESDAIPTLVFDEIDSGIGGEVGRALGEHLSKLSTRKQILCITHLASIAAYADTHIQVSKSEVEGRTVTNTREVTGPERVSEIARMLAGYSNTEVSLQHAQHLLETASKR